MWQNINVAYLNNEDTSVYVLFSTTTCLRFSRIKITAMNGKRGNKLG